MSTVESSGRSIIIGGFWDFPERNEIDICIVDFCIEYETVTPILDLNSFYILKINLSLYTTTAVILLDGEGNRILAKYYGNRNLYPTPKEQKVFEKGLFDKTRRANGEIILYDNHVVLYRSNIDVFFYVVGSAEENELLLSSILNAFYDAVSSLL
ncbi:6191_t:CDS:2, partial [Cetraspora pellucida]